MENIFEFITPTWGKAHVMRVYHGSNSVIEMPKIIAGKYTKDFGQGFYTTKLNQQAER